MQRQRFQVFVSSTFLDLERVRQFVFKAILNAACIPAGMEWWPAETREVWDTIQQSLADSDYYVLIIGDRYGSRSADGMSWTHKEFKHARKRDMPMLVFMAESRRRPANPQRQRSDEDKKIDAFCADIRREFRGNIRYWRSADELANQVGEGLLGLKMTQSQPGWIRGLHAEDARRGDTIRKSIVAIDANLASVSALSLEISDRLKTLTKVGDEIRNYSLVLGLKAELNDIFGKAAEGLLEGPLELLNSLAKARLLVPKELIERTFGLLLSAVDHRYDGVSNDDIDFWVKSLGRGYLAKNISAARHGDRIMTRVFVLNRDDVKERQREVSAILSEHTRGGISWGLALREDVEVARPEGFELDYGMFDTDKAVSFFHLQSGRRFEVVFQSDGRHPLNDREIARQLGGYRILLSNCLLISEGFATQHVWANDQHELEHLRITTRSRNERLSEIGITCEHEIFPVLAPGPTEIPDKLKQVIQIAEIAR
jgi:hypothetical protein